MAKPVKKRKRPPAKSKLAKAFASALHKKRPVTNPKFKLKIGKLEDPFFIHPETIPSGVALQWFTFRIMGEHEADLHHPLGRSFVQQALNSGWKLVQGCEVDGQALMWAPESVAKAQADAGRSRAQQQMAEARALFGMDGSKPSPYHGGIRIADTNFVESKVYESIPSDAPPIDVDVTIKVRVSARWQDAAAALGLEVGEYTRRRLYMEPIVLGPCILYENFSCKGAAYEPVQLLTKRID